MTRFDPYHQWLGIPPRDQPANHYRLLGIDLFEADAEVIANAADGRMAHVRTFQLGRHAQASQQILNELAAARVCLLSAEKRAPYDEALRAALAQCEPAADSPDPGLTFLDAFAAETRPRRGMRRTAYPLGILAALAAGLIVVLLLSLPQPAPRQPAAAARQASATGNAEHREQAPRQAVASDTGAVKNAADPPRATARLAGPPARLAPAGDDPGEAESLFGDAKAGGTAGQGAAKEPASPPPGGNRDTAAAEPSPAPAGAEPPAAAEPPGSPGDNELAGDDEHHPARMGQFITALCQDLAGNLWVGAEGNGVWRYSPSAERGRRWAQFTRARTGGRPEPDGPVLPARPADADCLGDDFAYALACDRAGRVWVGHLNHGVSVYNGAAWRNYDVSTGPLGERVFAIAVNSADGDVWVATSAGLTRYRTEADSWTHYTRADGLPADQVQCLAFGKGGTLYAGTQCDGLAIASPTRVDGRLEYRTWRVAAAPAALADRPPLAAHGTGLPGNLLNDLLVARDGAIYAATTVGLAASRDHGKTWRFLRGGNCLAKAKGLCQPPPTPVLQAIAAQMKGRTLLAEDYVTCLADGPPGSVWIGHREKGGEALDPRTGTRVAAGLTAEYVTRVLEYRGEYLAGTYGHGLCRLAAATAASGTKDKPRRATLGDALAGGPLAGGEHARLPTPAVPPSAAEITGLLAAPSRGRGGKHSVSASGPLVPHDPSPQSSPSGPLVVALPDDWRTQGDWLGRYGRYWACCCAICSPNDYVWGAGAEPVEYAARIGPHCAKNDTVRYWIHWLATAERRSLEMPPTYLHSRVVKGCNGWDKPRRQAEWDDHGEAYPRAHEGPDLYCTLVIPSGIYFLSLYDFNKDGHEGANRFRDYYVSIRAHDPSAALHKIDAFERQPELARARIRDFWGGAWKRFLVKGPARLTIRVARQDSLNTILAGVTLDPVEEEPAPYFAGGGHRREAAASAPAAAELARAIRAKLDELDELRLRHPAQWAACSRRGYVFLLRAARQIAPPAGGKSPEGPPVAVDLVGTCLYHCGLFGDWERQQVSRGLTTARGIEKSLRWDERTYSFSGRENEVLTRRMANVRIDDE